MNFLVLILFITMLFPESQYKEPSFALLKTVNNIQIRQYDEYIIAKTTEPLSTSNPDNNMFRTLASYIFGKNEKQKNIPMTAPVTTFKNDTSYDMIFYMLDSNSVDDLPKPSGQNITFEKFNLGKCAVISFSWFTSDWKIKKYEKKLKKFIENNGYTQTSHFMVNRYDSPWKFPWNRKNEVLVQIKENL